MRTNKVQAKPRILREIDERLADQMDEAILDAHRIAEARYRDNPDGPAAPGPLSAADYADMLARHRRANGA